jgi:hypothetical protein
MLKLAEETLADSRVDVLEGKLFRHASEHP